MARHETPCASTWDRQCLHTFTGGRNWRSCRTVSFVVQCIATCFALPWLIRFQLQVAGNRLEINGRTVAQHLSEWTYACCKTITRIINFTRKNFFQRCDIPKEPSLFFLMKVCFMTSFIYICFIYKWIKKSYPSANILMFFSEFIYQYTVNVFLFIDSFYHRQIYSVNELGVGLRTFRTKHRMVIFCVDKIDLDHLQIDYLQLLRIFNAIPSLKILQKTDSFISYILLYSINILSISISISHVH